MRFNQLLVWLGVFAGIATSASFVIWPYILVSEVILDVCGLLAAIGVVYWLVGLFFFRVGSVSQWATLLVAGSLFGMYVIISLAYFAGYIGYNYPASQRRLYDLTKDNERLTLSNGTLKGQLASTLGQLNDAKKVMTDPRSISHPAYNLDTSLRLQFDNDGRAQAIRVPQHQMGLGSGPTGDRDHSRGFGSIRATAVIGKKWAESCRSFKP
jgi:hypothetical protein